MEIAILTNFQDCNPGYSLTQIANDQVTMLKRHGHNVHFFVCEQFNPHYSTPDCEIHQVVPFQQERHGSLLDYKSRTNITDGHLRLAQDTCKVLVEKLRELNIDMVFAHDLIFTGWNMPYAMGIQMAGRELPTVRWLHWVHSVPSIMSDWWSITEYGPAHKLVFPNETDRRLVAEQFRGAPEDVRVIPHIKDLRSFYDFDEYTCKFIDEYQGVMQADFVQVYPASTDRLFAKRVDIVARILGQIKKRGYSVCLVIANQWATGRGQKDDVQKYYDAAASYGLEAGTEFIFTSDWQIYAKEEDKEDERTMFDTGLPKRMLRELLLCSNIFLFPTREESFGLVGPEAALSGAFMVLNKNLDMMKEIYGHHGQYFDFGSFSHTQKWEDEEKFFYDVGTVIIGRCWQNEVFKTRTYCRQMYNWDYLYFHVYEPIMGESKLWVEK